MDVIALGELLIDFVQTGTTSQGAPLMAANPGGAPLNFLGALAKYGCDCAMIGKVGHDAFGAQLVRTLKDAGIDFLGQMDEEAFTTLAFVSLDGSGERSFSFARKPGADTLLRPEEVPYDAIKSARVLHFGTLSLTDEPAKSATMGAVRFAREHGVTVSFDPNYRAMLWRGVDDAREAMCWGFAYADIVKAGTDELELAFDRPWREAVKALIDSGVRLVFATMGAQGCHFTTKRFSRFVGAFRVDAVDTTGAGDIFFGAAMSRLLGYDAPITELSEEQVASAARFGAAAAALSTKKPGGLPSIACEKEVLALAEA
ncbi:MAG TPA: carbohydrate kinase [Clostridia bacterium]|nr:carbohydrate kinase [Clostridia bacterium]